MQKMQKNINKIGLLYDKKHRMVYTDHHDVHYEISEESLGKYEFFYNRYLFSLALTLLVSIMSIYVAIGAGVLSVTIMELWFRKIFLNKCSRVEDFVPHPTENRPGKSKSQLVVLGLIYILLGALLLAFTFSDETKDQVKYISYGITLFAFFSGFRSLLSLRK